MDTFSYKIDIDLFLQMQNLQVLKLTYFRSHDESYARGVLTDNQYEEGKKRSLISMKMCLWGWIYDFITLFWQIFSTILRDNYNIPNIYMPDAILSFIMIPFLHLMNDEETKLIIFSENWFEGMKYVLGLRDKMNASSNRISNRN